MDGGADSEYGEMQTRCVLGTRYRVPGAGYPKPETRNPYLLTSVLLKFVGVGSKMSSDIGAVTHGKSDGVTEWR